MPAPAPLLSPTARDAAARDRAAAFDACAHRLAEQKGRDDIEILAITGATAGRVYGPFSSAPGITFAVDFTYTASRRQRRTATVTWASAPGQNTRDSLERFPSVPPAIYTYLATAMTHLDLLL